MYGSSLFPQIKIEPHSPPHLGYRPFPLLFLLPLLFALYLVNAKAQEGPSSCLKITLCPIILPISHFTSLFSFAFGLSDFSIAQGNQRNQNNGVPYWHSHFIFPRPSTNLKDLVRAGCLLNHMLPTLPFEHHTDTSTADPLSLASPIPTCHRCEFRPEAEVRACPPYINSYDRLSCMSLTPSILNLPSLASSVFKVHPRYHHRSFLSSCILQCFKLDRSLFPLI